jgi:predicted ATPase/class 3 adenylate cyclase
MAAPPTGTVTFLFTDIEGSTQLWERSREQMRSALAHHDEILRQSIGAQGGYVFKTVGDAFYAAFDSPMDAVAAAVAAQRALQATDWPGTGPLWVRMALHAGVAELRDDDYFGPALNRVARLLSSAHGGQVLLSSTVMELAAAELPTGSLIEDLGEHRLKDLDRPIRIYQLVVTGLRADFPALRTLDNRPNNLPVQLTRFVGREPEMARVRTELERARLVTILGVGGMGKTRLALQVAADLMDDFPDGVWLVELGPLADPGMVPQAVTDALSVREEPGVPTMSALTGFARAKRLLLVLDNCEHVAGAAAELSAALLRAAPAVRVLATSRASLDIAGEVTWPLPPLPMPNGTSGSAPDALAEVASVALFVDRATLHRPDFRLTEENAPAVAGICRRLDGIALAIELAAARVRMMTPEQILERLGDRFRLLVSSGRQAAVPQHKTLLAAIDWSYDLLNHEERWLLRQLAVFRGGWSLEAAEAVGVIDAGKAWPVMDLLGQLVDKSLVLVEDDQAAVRYRMLETIREYALERLSRAGELERAQERQSTWCLTLADDAATSLTGPEQADWLRRLSLEHENLRAALRWLTAQPDGAERSLRLAGSLHHYWLMQGHLTEGRRWLGQALAMSAEDALTAARAKALMGSGELAFRQGDLADAEGYLRQAITTWRTVGDRPGEAQTLRRLGSVLDVQGDYEAAMATYLEALSIWRETNDVWGIAATTNNLGLVARERGDLEAARTYLTQSLDLFRSLGTDWAIGVTRANLGDVALDLGDVTAAEEHYAEGLAIARRLGDREGIAYNLEGRANVARLGGDYAAAWRALAEGLAELTEIAARIEILDWLVTAVQLATDDGQPILAARLLGAQEALREEIAAPAIPAKRAALSDVEQRLTADLGQASFDDARSQGRDEGWQRVAAPIQALSSAPA